MSATENLHALEIACALGVLALLAVVTIFAYEAGIRRGKALGWCERHFADIAKDRARRARNGQFKSPEVAP